MIPPSCILSAVPWDDVINMRHQLVHACFDINLDVLRQTAQEDLPYLAPRIEPLLAPRYV